jgi:hypothetical protein
MDRKVGTVITASLGEGIPILRLVCSHSYSEEVRFEVKNALEWKDEGKGYEGLVSKMSPNAFLTSPITLHVKKRRTGAYPRINSIYWWAVSFDHQGTRIGRKLMAKASLVKTRAKAYY